MKPMQEQTLAELKQTAANEGIQGAEVFNSKAQLMTLIQQMRLAKGLPAEPEYTQPNETTTPPNNEPSNPEAVAAPEAGASESAPSTPADNLPDQAVNQTAQPAAPVDQTPANIPPTNIVETPTPPAGAMVNQAPLAPEEVQPLEPATTLQTAPAPTVTPTPTAADDANDQNAWKKETDQMKALLDRQKKIRMLVPLEPGEKRGTVHPVLINGYRFDILKGVYVDVPESVAAILADSFNQTLKAGEDISMDRTDDKTGRPMTDVM